MIDLLVLTGSGDSIIASVSSFNKLSSSGLLEDMGREVTRARLVTKIATRSLETMNKIKVDLCSLKKKKVGESHGFSDCVQFTSI